MERGNAEVCLMMSFNILMSRVEDIIRSLSLLRISLLHVFRRILTELEDPDDVDFILDVYSAFVQKLKFIGNDLEGVKDALGDVLKKFRKVLCRHEGAAHCHKKGKGSGVRGD